MARGTRYCGSFLFLTLVACGRRAPIESAYQEALSSVGNGHDEQALAQAESGIKQAEPGSVWYFRFRLLKTEILLARKESPEAEAELQFQIPSGPQWIGELVRYRLCQGYAALLQQRYAVARSRLNEAEDLAHSPGAANLRGEIELRKGSLAVEESRYDDADAAFRYALDYAVQHGDANLRIKATGNIGVLLLKSFRYEEAIPWFEKVLIYSRELGATENEARTLGNLGWCYFRLGDLDKALHYFQKAESSFERTGNRYERQIWRGNMGSIYLERREWAAASVHYKAALEMARNLSAQAWIITWLDNLAKISISTGDLDGAEKYNGEALERARKLNDENAEIYSTIRAAWIAHGRKDFKLSKQLFRSVIRSSPSDPTPLLDARAGLAVSLADDGRDEAAESQFRTALATVEHRGGGLPSDEHKLTYFSSLIKFYQEYVDFLMERGRSREALEVAESSHARVLSERLHLKGDQRGQHTASAFQSLAAFHNSTLLSYWLAPEQSYLWVVTPRTIKSFRLPEVSEIRAMIAGYDAVIQNVRDPLNEENSVGRKLYETLIAPAREFLAKSERAILVPDGPLYSLNFETLPVATPSPHYWIQETTVSIAPSLALLSTNRTQKAENPDSLLLIGNPVATGSYPVLEFAGQEMAAVEKHLPTFRKTILEGPQAHPEAYANSNPGRFALIHFVAHAAANPEEPLESAVILSRSRADGKLYAKDILRFPLHADLVTISACRSAGARIYAGEGLVGFSWAFLEAGARNVIAGLWDVNDRSTAELMANLYTELARGIGPASALRAAKLRLVQSPGAYRKPYYWAPFQLFTSSPAYSRRL
jgi:CHAT domain-containing protein/tetratricopeptide (TPR) repeat protein